MLEQGVPARISLGWCAVARVLVQVGAASGAQSFAILPALNESGRAQKPGLPHRRPKIQHPCIWIVQKDVGIVRLLGSDLGE